MSTSFNFAAMDRRRAASAPSLTDVLLPIVLAVPLLLFFTSKLRELAIAHRRLTVYASTDSLTQVMNRAAFSTLVDAYLTEVRAAEERRAAARCSSSTPTTSRPSTTATATTAATRRWSPSPSRSSAMLRAPDLVGRLGGEEFGVFLPGASRRPGRGRRRAHPQVGQRRAASRPTASPHPLSVSVGGAVFEQAAAVRRAVPPCRPAALCRQAARPQPRRHRAGRTAAALAAA